MIYYGWIPVFIRQMMLFKKKVLKMGYLFSYIMMPIIYLVVFGFGLGSSVRLNGTDYLSFLIPGLTAMTSMNNSYNWVATSLNLNRLYYKNFQVLIQAPISPSSIVPGEVLAGIIKGLFASSFIIVIGLVFVDNFYLTLPFIIALIVNSFMFTSFGLIVGMVTKIPDDISSYSNFFIMPMAFFSGTFFPLDNIPSVLKHVILVLPLTHTNILIREMRFSNKAFISLAVMAAYSIMFFIYGARLVKKYTE